MTIQAHIRLPDDLHAALLQIAEEEERSLNAVTVRLLRRAVENYQGDTMYTQELRNAATDFWRSRTTETSPTSHVVHYEQIARDADLPLEEVKQAHTEGNLTKLLCEKRAGLFQ